MDTLDNNNKLDSNNKLDINKFIKYLYIKKWEKISIFFIQIL